MYGGFIMAQANFTSVNWNSNNFFSGYVADNNIYTYTGDLIGVNLAKYQEVDNALKKCRDKLVELGVIIPEKKPEEIIKEQSELLQKQTDLCNSLMAKMQEMTEKIGGLNNGSKQNKSSNSVVTNIGTNETEIISSSNSDSTNSQSTSELHNGRCKKTAATK